MTEEKHNIYTVPQLSEITLDISFTDIPKLTKPVKFKLYTEKDLESAPIGFKSLLNKKLNPFGETYQATNFFVPVYNEIYSNKENKFKGYFDNYKLSSISESTFKTFTKEESKNYKLQVLKSKKDMEEYVKKLIKDGRIFFTSEQKRQYTEKKTIPSADPNFVINNGLGIVKNLIVNNPKATFLYKKSDSNKWKFYYIKLDNLNDISYCGSSKIICNDSDKKESENEKIKLIIKNLKEKKLTELRNKRDRDVKEIRDLSLDKTSDEERIKVINAELTENLLRNSRYYDILSTILDKSNRRNKKLSLSDTEIATLIALPLKDFDSENLVATQTSQIGQIIDTKINNLSQEYLIRYSKEKDKDIYTFNKLQNEIYKLLGKFKVQYSKYDADKDKFPKYKYKFTLVIDENSLATRSLSLFNKKDRDLLKQNFKDTLKNYKRDCQVYPGSKYSKKQTDIIEKCKDLCDPARLNKTDCSYSNWCDICRTGVNCTYGLNIQNKCKKNKTKKGRFFNLPNFPNLPKIGKFKFPKLTRKKYYNKVPVKTDIVFMGDAPTPPPPPPLAAASGGRKKRTRKNLKDKKYKKRVKTRKYLKNKKLKK